MDKEKIEFLDLKRQAETLKKSSLDKNRIKNATNPIMSAFLDFKTSKKFNIKDL